MPSAMSACEWLTTPTSTCSALSTTLTTTLTQVLRAAARARSAGEWRVFSKSSVGSWSAGVMRRQG
jgi:hypothetical protein